MPLPQRSRSYLGPATNTQNWDGFELRPDDIILSTPPKCGTTWSQAILMMLIHGQTVTNRPVWQESVWLDCAFRDGTVQAQTLDGQSHRRCIKTHTPLDGIPYLPDVTYLTVYRHPIDAHFSYKRHVENLKEDWLDFVFPTGSGAAFDRFLTHPMTDMGTDDMTLASILYHYQSFRAWAHLPNIHFFHYGDMTRDTAAQIRRFARATEIDAPADLIDGIAKASSFASMKETASKRVDPAKSPFKDTGAFFATGTSNKWVGKLTENELAAYAAASDTLADASGDRHWLECGSAAE